MSEVRTLYRVEGPEQSKVNANISFTLLSEDESGASKDVEVRNLTCLLSGPREVNGKVTRIGTGQYSLDFVPSAEGTYHLDVRTDGKPIFKKGDITTLISSGDPLVKSRINFEMEGFGIHSGKVGDESSFIIRVFDDHRHPTNLDIHSLEVDVVGDDSLKARVSQRTTGEYTATFRVSRAGDYTVAVSYDKRSVLNQKVVFSAATDASRSVVTNLPSGNVRVRAPVRFGIQSKDGRGLISHVGGDEWEAVASGPERINHLQITDNLDGTYSGEMLFPAVGVYSIDVRLQGVAASNSPFKVIVTQ